MAEVVMYHPETQATCAVSEDAMMHYRPGGWMLYGEWLDQERTREAQALALVQAAAVRPPAPAAEDGEDAGKPGAKAKSADGK